LNVRCETKTKAIFLFSFYQTLLIIGKDRSPVTGKQKCLLAKKQTGYRGYRVALCDPIWQVMLRSSEMGLL